MRFSPERPLISLAIAAVVGVLSAAPIEAQRFRGLPMQPASPTHDSGDENAGSELFPPPDHKLMQLLNGSRRLLDEHHYGEALDGLAQILDSDEDSFYQSDPKLPIYRGLKSEARQLLGQMPREGLNLYEARFGAEARARLDRAIASGDEAGLAEVSTRWFYTQAGYEATYLLGLKLMDRGDPLAAALALKRLRTAGEAAKSFEPGLSLAQAACYYQAKMDDDCRHALVDMKRRFATPMLELAGRRISWFAEESGAAEWLANVASLRRAGAAKEANDWAMFRGDAARNATVAGSAPFLIPRWRVDVTDNDNLEKALTDQQTAWCRRGIPLFPAFHPLAIDNLVFMRTVDSLLAVDLTTGRRLWQAMEDDSSQSSEAGVNPTLAIRLKANAERLAVMRTWEDGTYGTMSSDGSRLFAIEGLPPTNGPYAPGVMPPAWAFNQTAANRLSAYDIRSGKRQWRFDGRGARGNSLFFLGPPLPLRGKLYIIAESDGEVQLLAFDPATGKSLWSQSLCMVETNGVRDPSRRTSGVSPSYSDGVLICPTGAGGVAAVDAATHSLLWGYPYNTPNEASQERRVRMLIRLNAAAAAGARERWLDGTAVIAHGRVLVAPPDADFLYCINLADGSLQWSQPRGENRYIACVHDGAVVLASPHSLEAVKLADGSKLWSIPMPSGALLCGQGCYAGRHYFLPLSDGDVMDVDVASGESVSIAKSHGNATPGNLVCYRGRVLSQGIDGLEVYEQRDAARAEAARRLAANPNDVQGLKLRGEALMEAGRRAEAIVDFRRAYGLADDSELRVSLRALLRDALLAELHDDFVRHAALAAEIEPLLDEPAQRADFFRSMADGFHAARQWRQAVGYYMKLADVPETKPAMETVDRTYLVRRGRWVQSQLEAVRREGDVAITAEMDRLLSQRLEAARKEGIDGLKRFLAYFGNQPAAAAARAELLPRLVQAGRILEAELLLASTVESPDRKTQAALLADMAELELKAGRLADAAACVRQLRRQYAGVPCRADLTPDRWLAILPGGDDLRRELARAASAWPQGEIEVHEHDTPEGINPARSATGMEYDVLFAGSRGPFFADCSVALKSNGRQVTFCDGAGRAIRTVGLTVNGPYYPMSSSSTGKTCGHIWFGFIGTSIVAIDPWNLSGRPNPILWSQNPQDSADGRQDLILNRRMMREPIDDALGPVNARCVCFLRKQSLVAADPASGEPIWIRHDVPLHSKLFGDERYIFVAPPGSDEATVYRAGDGQALGVRKLPHRTPAYDPNQMANTAFYGRYNDSELKDEIEFNGRFAVTWEEQNGKRVLSLFDPWEQKPIGPQRTFDARSLVSMIAGEAVGVLEPAGHFTLVALDDGRAIADVQLPAEANFAATNFAVVRLADQYFVLVNDARDPMRPEEARIIQQPGRSVFTVRRGRLFALNANGKLAWPEGAHIDRQQFPLAQPGDLPALIFAQVGAENHNGQVTPRTSLLAVDRRQGRVLYKHEFANRIRGGRWMLGTEIEGSPAERCIRVTAGNAEVKLVFTAKQVPHPLGASHTADGPR